MKKFAVAICSATAISVAVSGCVTTSGGQSAATTGAQTGAAAGALIGFQRDGLSGMISGALIGALLGAAIGTVVDHVQKKSAEEVRKARGARDEIGIDSLALSNNVFRGGDKTNIEVEYTVNTYDVGKTIPIAQSIEYFQGDKKISSAQNNMDLEAGQYKSTFALAIPKGAEEGEYRAVVRLEGMNKTAVAEKAFRVTYARNGTNGITVAQISM